jgi:hypothetical protein
MSLPDARGTWQQTAVFQLDLLDQAAYGRRHA